MARQPQIKVTPELARETVFDAWLLCSRLAKRPCKVTRKKLSKLFRDGGKIETMIPICLSSGVQEQLKVVRVHDPVNALREEIDGRDFWTLAPSLQGWVEKQCGKRPVWEHVVAVRTAIDESIEAARSKGETSFSRWFKARCRGKWEVCLVTKDEDKKLGKGNAERYENAGIARTRLRDAII